MNWVAADAGFQIRYIIKDNWGEIVEALHTSQADLCPLIGTTPERQKKLDFTSTIIVEQVVLIVRKSTQGIHPLSDLSRQRIGVITRSVVWEMLKPNFEASLVEIDRAGDALFQLLAGRVDVLAVPKGVYLDMAQKADVADRINVVGEPLMELYRVMAVRKGLAEVNMSIHGGAEKILLVDDEAPIVRVEQQMLQRLGYKVEVFMSSGNALAAFKADPDSYDLVLTDMTMPDMTGLQLAEQLASIRPAIPVIICTGFSDKINQEKAKESGISGFLMKPVNLADMAGVVRKVLNEAKGQRPTG